MVPEGRRWCGSGGLLAGSVMAAALAFAAVMMATSRLGPASIPIWFMVIGGATVVLRGPLGKALAYRLSGELPPVQGPAELPEELYAELDDLRARLGELEERQDFSERLLARRDEPPAAG